VVDGQPAGLPSTRARIIIVQGPITQWNAILMKGNNLPPLVSLRAVLFGIDDAVRDFFQAAQYPDTCISRDYMCCVQFEQAGEIHRLVDAERWDVPIAKYVIGSLCLVEQTDDEDEGAGSDASTGIPTDNAEDDYQSWMPLSLDAGRDAWTRQLAKFNVEFWNHDGDRRYTYDGIRFGGRWTEDECWVVMVVAASQPTTACQGRG